MADERFLRQNPNPVPLDSLKHPDFDVREYRTDEDIANIRRSLERKGQIMPILVGAKDGDQYPILDGNHRFLAAKRAGWPDIDAIQTESGVGDDEAQIIANISRLELSQSEKLATFDYMLSVLDYTQSEAADAVGFDKGQVSRYVAILNGYGEIKEYFIQDELGVQACYELNKVPDRDRAVNIAQTAVREGYIDKDVCEQARNARGDTDADDVMRGAGSEQTTRNLQQVKRNQEALDDLDPIDQEGINEARVGQPQPAEAAAVDGEGQTPAEPQGPPCMACGGPMDPAPLSQVQFEPNLAQELGVDQLRFCENCTGDLINWWVQRQESMGTGDRVDTEDPKA